MLFDKTYLKCVEILQRDELRTSHKKNQQNIEVIDNSMCGFMLQFEMILKLWNCVLQY